MIAAVTLLVVVITALVISAVGFADDARAAFALTLPVPRGTWEDALGVAVNNVRVTVLPLGAALLVSLFPRGRRVFDLLLVVVLAVNAGLVGVALGGYGWSLAGAIAWHGTLELGAFAVAGAAYTAARRERITPRELVLHAACAWLLLAPAAVLEVRP